MSLSAAPSVSVCSSDANRALFEGAAVEPVGGSASPGAELSSFASSSGCAPVPTPESVVADWSAENVGMEVGVDLSLAFEALALAAASRLACRMAAARGVSEGADGMVGAAVVLVFSETGGGCVEGDGAEGWVNVDGGGGGLEGVFVAEGVGVTAAAAFAEGLSEENRRFCFISPYSFHSSTSSRSYIPSEQAQSAMEV